MVDMNFICHNTYMQEIAFILKVYLNLKKSTYISFESGKSQVSHC